MNKNDAFKIVQNVKQEINFSFAKNTTYGLGGSAAVAYFPQSIRQAICVYDYLVSQGIRFVTLGNGSNILASDSPFNGGVIVTKNMSAIYPNGNNSIFCLAGTKVSALLKYCAENGFGGIEYLAGIPASVGGLVYMNGGAGGNYIADNIVNVKIYDGKMRDLSNNYCNFGYKYSTMQDINCLVLGAELKIYPQSSKKVKQNIAYYLEKRSGQPKGKSCGCVFKNADGISAGKIIDEAGLKGLSLGGAKVSERHANFIINSGASSADVYSLIQKVKQKVYEKTGIRLEEEVVYIGDF